MPKAVKYKNRTPSAVNPLQRDEAHIKSHEKVLPVIDSLKSAKEKDRKWSSAIISELVQDDSLRLTLLREGIVNALLDRLTDDNREVTLDALGSIHALILKEGTLCKELYRKNIIRLLEAIFASLDAEWSDPASPLLQTDGNRDKARETLNYCVLEMLYTVLDYICDQVDEAAQVTLGTKIYSKAWDLLLSTLAQLPISAKIAIAQFCYDLTTDRRQAIEQVASTFEGPKSFYSWVENLLDMGKTLQNKEYNRQYKDQASISILTLLLGDIVVNICEGFLAEAVVPPKELIEITQNAKSVFASSMNSVQKEDNLPDEIISCLRTFSSIATYLDGYLEIHPESAPLDGMDVSMDDDIRQFEDQMEVDEPSQQLDPTLFSELASVIPVILQQKLPVSLVPHALETINDISWMMTLRLPDWSSWHTTAKSFLEFAVPRIEGMLSLGEDTFSTFMGCMWATAKCTPDQLTLDADDIQLLESIYSRFPVAELQAKIVGILGLAAQGESVESNKYITAFMMREISSQSALVVVEIMDSIMEIFADGEKVYDIPVFVEGKLLGKLKQAMPQLRKQVKKIDANKESDLKERAEGVLENFQEFLKYKEVEARNK